MTTLAQRTACAECLPAAHRQCVSQSAAVCSQATGCMQLVTCVVGYAGTHSLLVPTFCCRHQVTQTWFSHIYASRQPHIGSTGLTDGVGKQTWGCGKQPFQGGLWVGSPCGCHQGCGPVPRCKDYAALLQVWMQLSLSIDCSGGSRCNRLGLAAYNTPRSVLPMCCVCGRACVSALCTACMFMRPGMS
jgi:hypothetical protein